MQSIVLASHNQGKLIEFSELFSLFNLHMLSLNQFTSLSAEETGLTFVENAILKARYACKMSKLPALADDSGLVVPALGGEPGIFSARYAGDSANSLDNINKLLANLDGIVDRQAYFYCVLVLMEHENSPNPLISSGVWQGTLLTEPVGCGGFGYDPIFYSNEHQKSAAQLTSEVKNTISHRALALKGLSTMLKDNNYSLRVK